MSDSPLDSPANNHQPWLDAWYAGARWTLWLLPLVPLFILLSNLRRWWLNNYQAVRLATPVIVVGNISVGGTGKTPLLIALVKYLQLQGYKPGVISRGYGGRASAYPYLLSDSSSAQEAGDEPMSIYRQTGCAVCVGPDRIASARLLEDAGCDLLLSDDGLQHYRLARDIEIAVVDGQRGLGNGFRLPVGPLREAASRLKTVDWIVVNSPTADFSLLDLDSSAYSTMEITPRCFVHLRSRATTAVDAFCGQVVHAVAGIGNPQRFFNTLAATGAQPIPHSFPDHQAYQASDFDFAEPLPVVMTEKDAVKCGAFAQENWFYLAIEAQLPEQFWRGFELKINKVIERKAAQTFSSRALK